jgi:hypothetical protein
MYNYNLELFDYPLDIAIGEGEAYKDPSITEGEFGWYYTTVKPDFVFPAQINYEILEVCYIPSDNDAVQKTRSGGRVDLEKAAFERVGYKIDPPDSPQTRADAAPRGRIRVFDNSLDPNQYVPVQEVKIRCHTIIKWNTTYTDEDGFYTMGDKFIIWPNYTVVFHNRKGFDVWGDWWPFSPANYQMGIHSPSGHNLDITANNFAWQWAAVNNAGYAYYQMCEETGITKPPSNVKICVWKDLASSATPMLSGIDHLIGFDGYKFWLNLLVNVTAGVIVNTLLPLFKTIFPDIVIGTKNYKYKHIYEVTNHELSHSSHFSQIGSAQWAKYINYIITYGSYGDGTGNQAELCGIGEMWGYAMGQIQECERYEPNMLDSLYSAKGWDRHWFKPAVFWDLYRNQTLTKKEIFDCLTSDVDTFNKLIAKMHERYPALVNAIDSTFQVHEVGDCLD